MKRFFLMLLFFCFTAEAELICKSPKEQGDAASEAAELVSKCRPQAVSQAEGAVDRNVNASTIVANVAPDGSSPVGTPGSSEDPESAPGGGADGGADGSGTDGSGSGGGQR